MTFLSILSGFALALLVFFAAYGLWLRQRGQSGSADAQRNGKMEAELELEKSEKNKLTGQNKQMYAELLSVREEAKATNKDRDRLGKQLALFEAEEQRKKEEHETQILTLKQAQKAFDDARERDIRAEEERRKNEAELRDRQWKEHENSVIATLTELCKQPALSFASYTNTNLPEGFDGSLEPDFMIDFLGQYVIFDAKVSKAKSLRAYIDDQVKKTVKKVKGDDRIYKSIFLVVPTTAISELKNHHYNVDGYSLYVIPPEALQPILSCLKRISLYEFAEQMDPQQRENIVQVIAELDFHVNLRNAVDIILAKMGTSILEQLQKMDPELAEEVAIKKQPMNAKASLTTAEIKKLATSLTAQNEEVQRLVSPKTPVRPKDLQSAQSMLTEVLFQE